MIKYILKKWTLYVLNSNEIVSYSNIHIEDDEKIQIIDSKKWLFKWPVVIRRFLKFKITDATI